MSIKLNQSMSKTSRRIFLSLVTVSFCGLSDNLFGQDNSSSPQNFKYLQEHLRTPRLVGKGNYTYWGFDVYYASLWASESALKPLDWAEQRLALDLLYLRDFDGKDIAKRSIDEISKQSPLYEDKASAWLKTLERLFPNVHKGESLTGVFIPNLGAQFFFNGKPIGGINDLELAKRFFAIWLSPQTSAPDLRQKLFGD